MEPEKLVVRVMLVVEVGEEVGEEEEDREVVVDALSEGVVERQRVEVDEKLSTLIVAAIVVVGSVGIAVAVEHREAVGKADVEVVVVMVTVEDTDWVLAEVRV